MPTKQMSLSNTYVIFSPLKLMQMSINNSMYVTGSVVHYLDTIWSIFKSNLDVKVRKQFTKPSINGNCYKKNLLRFLRALYEE